MLIVCWSAKGGVGTTTVAAALAVVASRVQPSPPALLVDLAGDLPACLGLAEPGGPGIAEWLSSGHDVPPDALARLQVPVTDGLDLLPRGSGPLDPARASVLAQVLASSGRTVVVDAGLLGQARSPGRSPPGRPPVGPGHPPVLPGPAPGGRVRRSARRRSWWCVSPGACWTGPTWSGRSGCRWWPSWAVDPAVSRAVDAGLARSRLPRAFLAALAAVSA